MENTTTIYDLAKELNLSPSTISRGLNNSKAISAKTKQKILLKAKELGFEMNKNASSLRSKKTNTLGVIVPRLNSFWISTVLSGIEEVAAERGFNIIICQSSEEYKNEVAAARTLYQKQVDGLLVSVAYNSFNYDHFMPFVNKKIPLLFFDRTIDFQQCPKIVIDNLQSGYAATKHLLEIGRSKIVHITGNLNRNVYADRFEGYKKALVEKGINPDPDLIFETDLSNEATSDVLKRLFETSVDFDGAFISNDFCAARFSLELTKHGFKIPEQVAIVGFNNDPVSEVVTPNLSTINYPGKVMGEMAAKVLIDHIEGILNYGDTNQLVLNSGLVIRGSTVKEAELSPIPYPN